MRDRRAGLAPSPSAQDPTGDRVQFRSSEVPEMFESISTVKFAALINCELVAFEQLNWSGKSVCSAIGALRNGPQDALVASPELCTSTAA